MWQAIIAKQEDNLYYLLKAFAESFDDILKNDLVSDEQVRMILPKLKRRNKLVEEINANNKDAIKETNDKISEKNKKLSLYEKRRGGKTNISLGSVFGRKVEVPAQDKLKADKLISEIKQLQEEKKEILSDMEEVKRLVKEQPEIDAFKDYLKTPTMKNLQTYFDTRVSLDEIYNNLFVDEKDKKEIKPAKASEKNKNEFDASLRVYGWDGTEKTSNQVITNINQEKKPKTSSKSFTNLELVNNIVSINTEELKELVAANKKQLEMLTGDKKKLKEGKEYAEQLDELSDIALTGKATVPFVNQKTMLEQLKRKRERREELDSRQELIHSAHKGAIAKIVSLLQAIYGSRETPEQKRKQARMLQRKIENAVKNLEKDTNGMFQMGNLQTLAFKPLKEQKGKLKNEDLDPKLGLFPLSKQYEKEVKRTIKFYKDIYSDIALTEGQEDKLQGDKFEPLIGLEMQEGIEDTEAFKQMKKGIERLGSRIKGNQNLQEAFLSIYINFVGQGIRERTLDSVERFVHNNLFDAEFNRIKVDSASREKVMSSLGRRPDQLPPAFSDKRQRRDREEFGSESPKDMGLSEEQKRSLMEAAKPLYDELNLNTLSVRYGMLINDVLEDENLISERIARKTIGSREVQKLLSDPKESKKRLEYLEKFMVQPLQQVSESIEGESRIAPFLEKARESIKIAKENTEKIAQANEQNLKLSPLYEKLGKFLDTEVRDSPKTGKYTSPMKGQKVVIRPTFNKEKKTMELLPVNTSTGKVDRRFKIKTSELTPEKRAEKEQLEAEIKEKMVVPEVKKTENINLEEFGDIVQNLENIVSQTKRNTKNRKAIRKALRKLTNPTVKQYLDIQGE